ncbi:MauE/DoxX family redox-associated membrane protein [Cloacibacterium sp.]|uniref:MauE/DoxX family redox-associated membrane protein n=1 Tax=Cloacibacterium sp. TaxID=1913682 RepID=UPI0039E44B33
MKNFQSIIIQFTVYFHVLLFTYAAISKLLDFENFQIQLAQSPLLSAYAGIISYSVILIELILSIMLSIPKSRLIALYGSLYLMIGFSVYIYLILNYSDFIPCSCGGILEKLGWTEHLIFNISCVILLIISIYLFEKNKNKQNKLTIISTSLTVIISASMVYILFLNSEYIVKNENNFTRRFPHHPILEDSYLDLGVNSYYFAGIDKDEVYLGNTTSPLTLISIDKNFKNIKKHPVLLEEKGNIFKSLRIVVKAPYFYLYDGSIPIIYRRRIRKKRSKCNKL